MGWVGVRSCPGGRSRLGIASFWWVRGLDDAVEVSGVGGRRSARAGGEPDRESDLVARALSSSPDIPLFARRVKTQSFVRRSSILSPQSHFHHPDRPCTRLCPDARPPPARPSPRALTNPIPASRQGQINQSPLMDHQSHQTPYPLHPRGRPVSRSACTRSPPHIPRR